MYGLGLSNADFPDLKELKIFTRSCMGQSIFYSTASFPYTQLSITISMTFSLRITRLSTRIFQKVAIFYTLESCCFNVLSFSFTLSILYHFIGFIAFLTVKSLNNVQMRSIFSPFSLDLYIKKTPCFIHGVDSSIFLPYFYFLFFLYQRSLPGSFYLMTATLQSKLSS